MRVSTAYVRDAVGPGPAAIASEVANGEEEAWSNATGSCARESRDKVTCEEAPDRDRNALVGQLSGKYFHNKDSRDPVNRNGIVVIQVLKVRNLSGRRNFRERAHASGRAPFTSMLDCTAEEADNRLIMIDRGNTSQKCSGSGKTVKISLSVRANDCPGTDPVPSPDTNAAVNMLKQARTALASPSLSMEEEGLGTKLCAA